MNNDNDLNLHGMTGFATERQLIDGRFVASLLPKGLLQVVSTSYNKSDFNRLLTTC